MSILDLLRADGSIVVNKKLAKKIGLHEAVILSELISMYLYHRDRNELDNGYFYATMEKLEENTTLKRTAQDKAVSTLSKLGVISKVTRGLPARRYFTIHEEAISILILASKRATKIVENQQPDNGADSEPFEAEKPHNGQFDENQQTGMSENNKHDGRKPTSNNTKDNTDYNLKECMNEDSPESNLNSSELKKEVIKEISGEAANLVYEALEKNAPKKCYIDSGITMSHGYIDNLYLMLIKSFPNQLDPQIVEDACERYYNQVGTDIFGNITETIKNPVGLFHDCYKDAIELAKIKRNRP